MTYRLNPSLGKITSPVILSIGGAETSYSDGAALTELSFEKNYIVASITARDNAVVVTLQENTAINNISWIGEEAVSFM